MVKTVASKLGATLISRGVLLQPAMSGLGFSMAEKLDQKREAELRSDQQAAEALDRAAQQLPKRLEVRKSFSFHLGADLNIPTDDRRNTHTVDAPREASAKDPFEGLPLRRWAERMGERIMPAYELIKEEQKKSKMAAKAAPTQELAMPSIPHLLPFTRWAAKSKEFRDTFVAEDPKTRKRARLSWYHPDDTMVPRDWFRGGLLEDLKYYAPFSKPAQATAQ